MRDRTLRHSHRSLLPSAVVRTAGAVLVLAGCGARAPAPTPVDNAAGPSGAVPPCPTGEALERVAARAWDVVVPEAPAAPPAIDVTCVAARAGDETRWILQGTVETGGDPLSGDRTVDLWTALVTPAGERRWIDGTPAISITEASSLLGYDPRMQVADLDGDGFDEVLVRRGFETGEFAETWLAVWRLDAGDVRDVDSSSRIVLAATTASADGPSTPRSCTGALALPDDGDGRRRIEVTYEGACERSGVRAWRYVDGALVELTE